MARIIVSYDYILPAAVHYPVVKSTFHGCTESAHSCVRGIQVHSVEITDHGLGCLENSDLSDKVDRSDNVIVALQWVENEEPPSLLSPSKFLENSSNWDV